VLVVASRSESKPPPKAAPSAAQEPTSVSNRGPSTETVAGKPPIAGLTVSVEAQGEASWKLTISNHTDGMLTIVWDESTFVAGDGKSWGRLVPSGTRLLDIEKPHAPSPLAPHASLDEVVVPETRVALSGFDYDWRRDINGGRLYLTFQIGSEKKSWTATVTESDVTSLGWWCWSLDGRTKCSRTHNGCDGDRALIVRLGLKPTQCAPLAGPAWCFIMRSASADRISPCWDSEERCGAVASDRRGHERDTIEVGCTERP
jgi:hypothetical protein